ncbi:NfeD family protein [Alkalicoccus daliensis]|uniref:Membrane-bound serine protease (ClpP class) n=1 Tax=Alkalicoccus daliensis TaxID=745820 RepID=A0A1H0BDA8_9BACI|nr:nodulation protein NfeD [Alkalicoccus daliensis]SDN43595.1 membrane-bound serine protease (ClpP class) [Alkalicoccus daliensis]
MKNIRIMLFSSLLVAAFAMMIFVPSAAQTEGEGKTVYFVPVEETVERGLESFLSRAIETAEEESVDHIVLEMNTPGGRVDAAGEIAKVVRETEIPTTAYVVREAMSAGAYISLNANEIVMQPGTEMGSAQVIDGTGNAAEDKAQSAWLGNMRSAAEINDRDPQVALAMADPSIEIEELNLAEGELLTLTASEAVSVGYAEAIAADREELLEYLGLEGAEVQEFELSFAERIARIVTHPVVIPILLSVGGLGLVLELYSPGFGIPGIMGASALFLFFFGHTVAGFAGWEALILFIVGAGLLVLEVFSPSFGLFGILGLGAILTSLIMSSFSTVNILISFVIAVLVTITGMIILMKYIDRAGPMKRVVLNDATTTELGYISSNSRDDLAGKTGESLTVLRPSGSAMINDERLDVVSEGGYIEQGRKIKVVSVSGSKIVVRETRTEDKDNKKEENE